MITKEKVDEASEIYNSHIGQGVFNYDGMYKIILRCITESINMIQLLLGAGIQSMPFVR